jgi:Fe-S cluster assembly iron-binding protein IscA
MESDMNHDNANLVIDDKALQQVENQVIDFVRRNSSLEAAKHLQLA